MTKNRIFILDLVDLVKKLQKGKAKERQRKYKGKAIQRQGNTKAGDYIQYWSTTTRHHHIPSPPRSIRRNVHQSHHCYTSLRTTQAVRQVVWLSH